MIVVDLVDITVDVLYDVALVPVSMCTPEFDAKVLGGAADLVQMLSPKLTKTFQEDVDRISFHTHLQFAVTPVDIVWDVYKNDGLEEASTRDRRGCDSRSIIPSARLPSKKKPHLFEFIAKYLSEKQYDTGKQLVTITGDNAQCCPRNTGHIKGSLQPCSHEVDAHVILHANDFAQYGLHSPHYDNRQGCSGASN
jgi:hypothetical protein